MKYTFESYYKYCFRLRLDDGTIIYNEDQDPSEIYRLGVEQEGIAEKKEDYWLVDGTKFIAN